ncbi:MAG: type II secretion system F family protein [Anaerolineaceae bacterium]|jgi:tight adherence protein C
MIAVIIAVAIIIGTAAVLVAIGLRNPQTSDEKLIQQRLEEFSQRGEVVDLEDIELSQPFTQRIIYPVARTLGQLAIRFTPQNALQSTAKKLELAGSPVQLDPTMFLALQFIAAVLFGGLITLLFSTLHTGFSLVLRLLLIAVTTFVGFFFPQVWISSVITQRQRSVRRAMPDALDLLTICVEAGLGFDAAMAKVSEKWVNELSLAFARVLQEINLGKLRRDALRDMAERIGISEMTSFVAAVIQSEMLGVSMAKVLRIQSDQMRVKRRQRAEEEAHKAPIKMLIPMALLIFPSLMIVLLTPAALKLFHSSLGGMFK